MPIITLTDGSEDIIRPNARHMWWRVEILAYSFYPSPAAGAARRKWARNVLRGFASDWTSSRCLVQPSTSAHQRWMALDGSAREQHEPVDLKRNEDRDLKFAVSILLRRLEGLSKTQAVREIAEDVTSRRAANSLGSATAQVKRAWRKFNTACHFVAAELIVGASERAKTRIDQNVIAITTISLAEKLRRLAEGAEPGHGSVHILDREKTWKVPSSFPFCSIKIEDWLKG